MYKILIYNDSYSFSPIFSVFLLQFEFPLKSFNIAPKYEPETMLLFYKMKLFIIKRFGKKEHRIKVLFDHHFFINKYYLQKSASAEDLSRILNISNADLELLSFNHHTMGFEQLRDMYRFQHFWDEFTNPLNAELPIQSIISLCGFSSSKEFNTLLAGHKEASKNILKKNFS
jgi:hypothetical protein